MSNVIYGRGYLPYIQSDVLFNGYSIVPQQYDTKQLLADTDSEYDSDESVDTDYTSIDSASVLRHAIAVWSYLTPDSITLFTPAPDDTLFRVVNYAEQNLGFNRLRHRIMVMKGGESTPKEMTNIYLIQPGSVVMVMPKTNVTLNVEISQLKSTFPVSADPMCSLYEIKSYIKRTKGIPIEQQDILYRDKVLENSHRLYEYKVKDKSTLHVLIQVHFDLLVNIETFWGKVYRLYVDRCSTGSDLIYTIFGRTFSKTGPKQVTIHELFVPTHVLLLQHRKQSISWEYCLGRFGIRSGESLVLTTVGKESEMNMQVLKVVSENGEVYDVEVSQFDRWAVVAFILHGKTDVPVDLIRLFKDSAQVNFTSVIGEVSRRQAIVMNVVLTNLDHDIMLGIPLKINLGNGIIENIKVAPSKKVKMVKKRLENMGVPNATMYELAVGKYKLPNGGRLQDVVFDIKSPLFLVVEKFPVFIHGPEGVIYKTIIDVNHTIKDLKHKIQLKTGHALSECRLLMAGQEINEPDDLNLYENGYSTRTSIFVQTSTFSETFFITKGGLLIKLKIPLRPSGNQIKKKIWDCRDVPEGSITCLQTFFFWFFHPRVNKKFQFSKKRKTWRRLPVSTQPLVQASERARPIRKTRKAVKEDLRAFTEVGAGRLEFPEVKYRGIHQYKPAVPRGDKDDNKTWPQPDQPRDVESWVQAGHYHDIHRQDITLPAAPDITRHEKKPTATTTRRYDVIHHVTPRWMGSLLRRSDENRLAATDGDVVMGRTFNKQIAEQGPYRSSNKAPKHLDPILSHQHGDNTTLKYLQPRPMYYHQQVMYSSTEDSDGD